MFADEADAAVDAIPALSGKFRALSTRLWTPCRDLERDLEHAARELVHADRLVSLRFLPQALVELRADEEDDDRDEEVRDDHHEQQEVPCRRFVAGHVPE